MNGFKLLVVIGTQIADSCKSNYNVPYDNDNDDPFIRVTDHKPCQDNIQIDVQNYYNTSHLQYTMLRWRRL